MMTIGFEKALVIVPAMKRSKGEREQGKKGEKSNLPCPYLNFVHCPLLPC
jgi:hypothetical protein